MSQYRITATITSQTQATDSGAWQMGITWRKSLTLDPAETQEAADLRNQAWEQAANGIDDETTRRIWQQVDTVTAREAERLRAQVRKLIGLLNAGRIDLSRYITGEFPFSQINEAFQAVAVPNAPHMKVVVSYESGEKA